MGDKHKGEPPPGGGNSINNNENNQEVKAMLPLSYKKNDLGPFQVMIESVNVYKSSTRNNTPANNTDSTQMNVDTVDNLVNIEDELTDKEPVDKPTDKEPVNNNKQVSGNVHIGNFSHLSIAKTILNMKLDHVSKLEKKGKNRLCITFSNRDAANAFLVNKSLLEKGYSMFIPANLVSCKGIVRHVDKSLDTDEILKESETFNVEVISVKRLNRRIFNETTRTAEFKPTTTVLFTFSGKILPRFVNIFRLPMPVEPYILPVIQCQGCFLYGHTKKNCNANERCKTCSASLKNHPAECKTKCLHCSADHISSNRICPEFERQKLIRQIMSVDNLSFFDANLRVPKRRPNNEYISSPNDFPTLPKDTTQNNIHVHERRNYSSQVPAYNKIASKRPRVTSPTVELGYDKLAHDLCLISPNGRNPSEHFTKSFSPSEQNSVESTMVDEPSVVTTDSVSSMFFILDNMTVTEKESFLKELFARLNLTLNSNTTNHNAQPTTSNHPY